LELKILTEKECYGTKSSSSGTESPLTCWEASSKYGISIRHGKMCANGELRFRLISSDGSAYIKTVTTNESEGWQNPHYHNYLKETYIVEEGWVGYIEYTGGETTAVKFNKGDVFTTKPGVSHNLYMPKDAVIHTIKHGSNKGSNEEETDWHSDSKASEILNSYVENEQAINFKSVEPKNKLSVDNKVTNELTKLTIDDEYTESYKHFDNLIWKVPSWSTAVFGIFVGGLLSLYSKRNVLEELSLYIGSLTLFFSLFIATLSYTLFKFRCHQINTKKVRERVILSPQFFLQLLINIEAIILFVISVALLNIEVKIFVTGFIFALTGVFTIYSEVHLSAIAEQNSELEKQNPKKKIKQLGS
jgi:mannose-6-phosphate isomerase-like protein (cupin superfamily)